MTSDQNDSIQWYVAHTRPRCEKKLARYCLEQGVSHNLPCYRSVRKYPRKVVEFQKPLFPGYLFLEMLPHQRQKVFQSDYVANLLDVPDQDEFRQQLGTILEALQTELEIRLAPEIKVGSYVTIKRGPLQGMVGWVGRRSGMVDVLLRLDFIGQAASVRMHADELEPV